MRPVPRTSAVKKSFGAMSAASVKTVPKPAVSTVARRGSVAFTVPKTVTVGSNAPKNTATFSQRAAGAVKSAVASPVGKIALGGIALGGAAIGASYVPAAMGAVKALTSGNAGTTISRAMPSFTSLTRSITGRIAGYDTAGNPVFRRRRRSGITASELRGFRKMASLLKKYAGTVRRMPIKSRR